MPTLDDAYFALCRAQNWLCACDNGTGRARRREMERVA
jgi:hypothetical protein